MVRGWVADVLAASGLIETPLEPALVMPMCFGAR